MINYTFSQIDSALTPLENLTATPRHLQNIVASNADANPDIKTITGTQNSNAKLLVVALENGKLMQMHLPGKFN